MPAGEVFLLKQYEARGAVLGGGTVILLLHERDLLAIIV